MYIVPTREYKYHLCLSGGFAHSDDVKIQVLRHVAWKKKPTARRVQFTFTSQGLLITQLYIFIVTFLLF